MKSNPLVKFLVIPFAILALFMVVKLFSKDSSEKQTQAPETLVLSTGEAKSLALTAIPRRHAAHHRRGKQTAQRPGLQCVEEQ